MILNEGSCWVVASYSHASPLLLTCPLLLLPLCLPSMFNPMVTGLVGSLFPLCLLHPLLCIPLPSELGSFSWSLHDTSYSIHVALDFASNPSFGAPKFITLLYFLAHTFLALSHTFPDFLLTLVSLTLSYDTWVITQNQGQDSQLITQIFSGLLADSSAKCEMKSQKEKGP